MSPYLKAVWGHVGPVTLDTLFVAIVSMGPLLLGRLASLATDRLPSAEYFSFLYNGQLAFYSMSSLATLALLCLRKRLPDQVTLLFGFISLACIAFLVALVGADPTLQKGQAFLGPYALYLYGGVLIMRIVADAMKAVGAIDALDAGAALAKRAKNELADRMGNRA